MFFHLPSPRHFWSPIPSSSNHFKIQRSLHIFTILSQYMPLLSQSTLPGQSVQSLFQTHKIYSSWLLLFVNQFISRHCSYYCYFSSQNCHLILPQTPHLATAQHCRPYSTLIYLSFQFQPKRSFIKQFLTLPQFYPSDPCSCFHFHRCFKNSFFAH